MNNIFSIVNLNNSSSLAKALLFFYIVLANNFTKDLYAGQLKEFIESNRLAQHMIGLITMLLVVTVIGEVRDPINALLYTIICYSWFILTTKLDLKWNLIIIILLVIGFLYENKMLNKEIESESDKALYNEDKQKIKLKNNHMKTVIVISIIIVTAIGTFLYINKKQVQYGGNFDIDKFLFDGSKNH